MNLAQFLAGRLAKGIVVLFAIAVLNFLVGKFVVFRKKTAEEYEDF